DVQGLVEAYAARAVSRRRFIEGALKLGLSVPAVGALLAACSSDDDGTSPAATAGGNANKGLAGRVQILVGFGTGNSPTQVPVQEALAQAFTAQHPDVKIDFVRVPGSSDARTKLTTLIAGGEAPDIVMPAGLYGVSLFVDQDVWLDLGPFLDRDGLSLDSFSPETAAATRVPNYYGAASQAVIGVPVGVHDHALAYNEELFAKAGVAPPPASWDDDSWTLGGKMLDTARALTFDSSAKNSGQAGFDAGKIAQYGMGHFFRETVFYAFGGHLYDASTRKARFDTPEAAAGLQFAADLVNVHQVQPSQTQVAALGAGGEKGSEEQFAWRSGKLAMIDMCSCDIKSPFGTDVAFAWKAAAIPAGPARRFGFLNLDVATLVKAGTNHDLAWEVLKFFSVDPANERRLAFDSYGAVPPLTVNRDAFAAGIARDLPKVDPKVWIDGFGDSSPENEAWFPAFAEVNDMVGKTFDQVIGGSPAGPALAGLQQQAQAKIDAWFQTHKLPN
ncbi:MAG: extracellular solute-binding protein, partial [Acidimicrobiales bacterium]